MNTLFYAWNRVSRPKTMEAAVRAALLEPVAIRALGAAQAQGLTVRHLPPEAAMLVNEWAYCRAQST